MAVNTFRKEEIESDGGESLFQKLSRLIRVDDSIQSIIHVKYLPQILFIAALSVIYIANRHKAEKKIRNIAILEQQVEDLRADYTTLKASYMFESKQSEVAKRAERIGLVESNREPILITKE